MKVCKVISPLTDHQGRLSYPFMVLHIPDGYDLPSYDGTICKTYTHLVIVDDKRGAFHAFGVLEDADLEKLINDGSWSQNTEGGHYRPVNAQNIWVALHAFGLRAGAQIDVPDGAEHLFKLAAPTRM